MSNGIPKQLHELIEKLREQGVNVSVASITTGEVDPPAETNSLRAVMAQALKAMREHNLDSHQLCMTMNAMEVIGFLVAEGHNLLNTIDHLAKSHKMQEAAEWSVATLKLLSSLDATVRSAEAATGNAFQFTNENPDAESNMAARIVNAEAVLEGLKESAETTH